MHAKDGALLQKINVAVAAANEAEKTAETAKAELVSRSKAVGMLLLEARKLHPSVKDFEAFLKRVDGLKLSRAYDLMRLAGGRTTDEQLKKDARERKQRSRAKKIPPRPAPTPKRPEPPLSVTDPDVTEKRKAKVPPWMDAARQSSHWLAEFTFACRTYLPRITVEADREEARRLVAELTGEPQSGGCVMADRNSIIEKIKALLAKTTGNGATEAEMLSALDKAAAMMDAYDISDEELQVAKDEAAMLHADPPDLKDPHSIKWRLSPGVSEFCGVEIYRSRHETGLRCIGMPSDVQFAMWLLDNLADFVFAELYAHLIGCLAPKSERRIIMRSFTAACCDRIAERLLALVERSKAARTSNGRELVVIKNAAIKAFMKAQGIHLRSCSGHSPSNIDAVAQAAGRAAGDRASFGRPVTGAAGVLRLGK